MRRQNWIGIGTSNACRGSECGNNSKYPGGAAPTPPKTTPKCDPKLEVVCGELCCATYNQCCPDASGPGGYKCWSSNHKC